MNAPNLGAGAPDITETLFLLPADAKCLPVSELTSRLRDRIGPVDPGQSVITRPGFRLTPRLVTGPLAALVGEFREPSRITDAVLRFSRAHDQDPTFMLEQAFDALATLIEGRILVPSDSLAAGAPEPSLGAGQGFGGWEIEFLVRSLDDTEVYKARDASGRAAALKIARDDRADIAALLENEARILGQLDGLDSPLLYGEGVERDRAYVAMEWCAGTSIATAAQQARAARDRGQLHRLVAGLFDAYARLHDRGFLHGDIHTGNVLVAEDGRIMLLDFGAAVRIGEPGGARGGIPHFYDPEAARALLQRRMAPPASPASEQYALGVLAYLLLTGLHPVQSSAVHDELLRRIARRPPLPFATRGVAAWPEAEAVIGRGLAKRPGRRFPDLARLARAWAGVGVVPERRLRPPAEADQAFAAIIDGIRNLAPSREDPLERAWLALRAALAFEDPELLAAADILAGAAGSGWAARSVAAQVARARSDAGSEQQAITAFVAAAAKLEDGPEAWLAALAAAEILDGVGARPVDVAPLLAWAAGLAGRRPPDGSRDPALRLHAALAMARTGALRHPGRLKRRLDALAASGRGNPWLWADAHSALGSPAYMRLALAAPLPGRRAGRGFALLRLHQLTGEWRWVEEAARAATRARGRAAPTDMLTTLLKVELEAPERTMLPSFLLARILRV